MVFLQRGRLMRLKCYGLGERGRGKGERIFKVDLMLKINEVQTTKV
jgi:hypothetical protein